MCVLYASVGSKVRPRTVGCVVLKCNHELQPVFNNSAVVKVFSLFYLLKRLIFCIYIGLPLHCVL